MILELEDAIIQRLKSLGLTNVEGWSGRPEDLFMKPKTYPAFRIVFENMKLQNSSSLVVYESTIRFIVLIFFRSLRDKGQGAYGLIEQVLKILSGYHVYGFTFEPLQVALLYHELGEFAYQVSFEGSGRFVLDADYQNTLLEGNTIITPPSP
jgi:hypothetical protein